MKTRSTFYSLLFAIASMAFFANCSGNKNEDGTSHEAHDESEHASGSTPAASTREPQFQVDEKFQQQLGSFFSSYIELKEALVDSDADKVQSEAQEAKAALAKVDMQLVSGVAHNDWMNYVTPMESSLNEIQSAKNIETQRKSFSTLSDNLYKSIKAFGLGGKEAFYEHCPMAFNNEGAYWLSDENKIRNPYFGDKMLTCGEVKERLQ